MNLLHQGWQKSSHYRLWPPTHACIWLHMVTSGRWERSQSQQLIHYSRKRHTAHKFHASMFYRTRVTANGSYTLREQRFSSVFATVTLNLTQWPSYTNLSHILHVPCQCFQKSSYHRQTERHIPLKWYTITTPHCRWPLTILIQLLIIRHFRMQQFTNSRHKVSK